jgi:hypothetical protein
MWMAATISPKDYAQEGVEGNVGTLEQSCGCQSYHAVLPCYNKMAPSVVKQTEAPLKTLLRRAKYLSRAWSRVLEATDLAQNERKSCLEDS